MAGPSLPPLPCRRRVEEAEPGCAGGLDNTRVICAHEKCPYQLNGPRQIIPTSLLSRSSSCYEPAAGELPPPFYMPGPSLSTFAVTRVRLIHYKVPRVWDAPVTESFCVLEELLSLLSLVPPNRELLLGIVPLSHITRGTGLSVGLTWR